MNGLDTLRSRYPWPNAKPDVAPMLAEFDGRPDGWCCGQNVAMFGNLCKADSLVVELGTWLGRSATHFMDLLTEGTLICVDHWLGSDEHQRDDCKHILPVLYDTFLHHLWASRDQLIPMRVDVHEGLGELHTLGIAPDVIYIDDSHHAKDVCQRITTCLQLFPAAQLCGDDWTWDSVREGVAKALVGQDKKLQTHDTCWWLT